MDFDPDAYLASKAKPVGGAAGFDPDAYLASKGASSSISDTEYQDAAHPGPAQAKRMGALFKEAMKDTSGDSQMGIPETAMSGVTGLASSAAGGLAGAARTGYNLLSGEGLDKSVELGAQTSQKIQQAGTYQPRTAAGKLGNEILSVPFNAAKQGLSSVGGDIGQWLNGKKGRLAGEAIGGVTPDVAGVLSGGRGALRRGEMPLPQAAEGGQKFSSPASASRTATPNSLQNSRAAKVQQALAEDGPRIQTIIESNKAGLKIPPSQITNSKMASVAENIASDNIGRDFSLKNQPILNRIIASEDLGLKPGTPLTQAVIDKAKEPHNATYQKIKNIQKPFALDKKYLSDIEEIGGERTDAAKRFPTSLGNNDIEALRAELKGIKEISPADAMVLIKEYRRDATTALRSMDDPAKLEIGMAKRAAANAVEGMVERNLSGIDKNLYSEFVKARKSLAKINNADAALIESTGDINAKLYAKLYEKGAPLDGGSLKVGKFASAFPHASRTPKDIGPNSKGSISAWTVARPLSREAIASKTVQDALIKKYRNGQP